MKRILVALLFALVPLTVSAQTHPCDVVPPNNPQAVSPIKFSFCIPQTAVATITAFKVYAEAGPSPVFNGPLTPTGAPNAAGFVEVQTPPLAFTPGNHSVQSSAVTIAGEGAKSAAYPFAVVGLPPAPSNLRIVP